ncbi:MAG: hypothetical protein RO469_04645 [Thermincola sp.]|jgi:imidazole glycerol phosphate synthase subunit HisF|nr:hypothetical protein [Thermincola sp.]MDT3703797.1 hypothetical protein [Thermincola sp.]
MPCLDIKGGRVVKGVHFVGLQEIVVAIDVDKNPNLPSKKHLSQQGIAVA